MQSHDPAHATHGGQAAPAAGARDPDFGAWLGATLLVLAVLAAVFVLPATHAAGPTTPVRPLAPEPGEHELAEGLAGMTHGAGAHGAPVEDDDRDRLSQIFGALSGMGVSDSSVPASTIDDIKWLIQTVAESGLRFTRDGNEVGAIEMALSMVRTWEKAEEPIYSPEAFIRRVAGHTVVDQKLNRVILKTGGDMPLNTWLTERLAEHRAGH